MNFTLCEGTPGVCLSTERKPFASKLSNNLLSNFVYQRTIIYCDVAECSCKTVIFFNFALLIPRDTCIS